MAKAGTLNLIKHSQLTVNLHESGKRTKVPLKGEQPTHVTGTTGRITYQRLCVRMHVCVCACMFVHVYVNRYSHSLVYSGWCPSGESNPFVRSRVQIPGVSIALTTSHSRPNMQVGPRVGIDNANGLHTLDHGSSLLLHRI